MKPVDIRASAIPQLPHVRARYSLALGLVKPGQMASLLPPKKKALLIAINYSRTLKLRLMKPQKEVKVLRHLLEEGYGYSDITVLTDDAATKPEHQPTRANIMREIEAFVKYRQPGDQFFFYYAGHAYQDDSNDPDEEDNKDELILPVDAADAQDRTMAISDDFLKQHLVEPLNNVKAGLVAVFDSCHSATLLNLPHHRCNRVCSWFSPFRRVVRFCIETEEKVRNRNYSNWKILKNAMEPSTLTKKMVKQIPAEKPSLPRRCSGFCLRYQGVKNNVICISACKDSQQTFDCVDKPSMTMAFIDLLRTEKRPTLKRVMRTLSSRDAYEKEGKPQISSLKPLWMNTILKL